MKKTYLLFILVFTLTSCMDVFTNNVFSSLATDVSDMSSDELSAYLDSTPLSDISAADLLDIENTLASSRIVLSDDDLDNKELVTQYLKETTQLLDINMAQADVEGLISDVLNTDDGDTDFVDTLLADTDRLDNIAEASDYAVDAYLVDPDSLTNTELIVGSVGLLSDILQDDTKSTKLDNVTDFETSTLETAGFTADEISDIQTAHEMMALAESNSGADSPLADLFEGMPV